MVSFRIELTAREYHRLVELADKFGLSVSGMIKLMVHLDTPIWLSAFEPFEQCQSGSE